MGSVYGGGTVGTGAMPRPDGLDPVGVEITAHIPKGCNPLAKGGPPGIAPLTIPHPNGTIFRPHLIHARRRQPPRGMVDRSGDMRVRDSSMRIGKTPPY